MGGRDGVKREIERKGGSLGKFRFVFFRGVLFSYSFCVVSFFLPFLFVSVIHNNKAIWLCIAIRLSDRVGPARH